MYLMYNWDTRRRYIRRGGYSLWLDPSCSADIDLAELCFWLPWQISSGWKWIRLSYIANTLSGPNVDTKMTNEQISYMANIYTFALKERQLSFRSIPFQILSRSNKNFEFFEFNTWECCSVSLPFCHFLTNTNVRPLERYKRSISVPAGWECSHDWI